MEIIIGTYEEFLVGFRLIEKNNKLCLEQSFTNHAHNGSIRALATSNKYLASGSIDEVIHLINIRHRIETGTLISHTGTITALEFLRTAYLFSSSEDGNICIWNTQKWSCEKILRGHKGPITSINLHSSGKLLLSVSKDKTLRAWNLIKGRCAYIINLKEMANQILWSPTCIYFAVVFDNHIDIYDISTGSVKYQIDQKLLNFNKRLHKVIFIDDDHLIICGDSQELIVYNAALKSVINRIEAHQNRIKDILLVNPSSLNLEKIDAKLLDTTKKWLLTTSSDGFIKIWSLNTEQLNQKPTLLTEVNSTCRPTCMVVWKSNENYEKFENFVIPELKITETELETCKAKLRAKKSKTINSITNNHANGKDESMIDDNANMNGYRNDADDDKQSIEQMKASSKVIQKMIKLKKKKKKKTNTNPISFKLRLKQKNMSSARKMDNNFKNSKFSIK